MRTNNDWRVVEQIIKSGDIGEWCARVFQGGHSDEVYDRRYGPAKHFTQPGADYGTEVLFFSKTPGTIIITDQLFWLLLLKF